MNFRKSELNDLEDIMVIIEYARNQIKKLGIPQWQDGYPRKSDIEKDINQGISYIIEENDEILGTVVLSFEKENDYNEPIEGKWLTNENYAVIHRIAVKNKKDRSIALDILKNIEEICKSKGIFSIKVDTHEGNIAMRKFLEKNKFKYCGVIYLENNKIEENKRVIYEKIL